METAKSLSDFERKLITIIQHYNQEHKSPGIATLKQKTGHNEEDIQQTIRDLVSRRWLVVHDKFNVYLSRGKLPKPDLTVSGTPYWELTTCESFVKELEK